MTTQKTNPNQLTILMAAGVIISFGLALVFYSYLFGTGLKYHTDAVLIIPHVGEFRDFPAGEEGSVVIQLNVREVDITIDDLPPERILLFKSKTVPGLGIYYIYATKALSGGLPLLTSGQVNLLDGNSHEIAYTFKRGANQTLYFDKAKIAEAAYNPVVSKTPTGFLVKNIEREVISDKTSLDVLTFDKALTEETIKKI